jgi:putative spermidine/putrescine transport system substrate-binding protein
MKEKISIAEGFMVTHHSRRGFLRNAAIGTLAAATGAAGLSALGGPAAAAETFTIANWGGVTSRAMETAWGKPFTAKTKMPVQPAIFDYGKFTAQIKEGKIIWDWADLEGWYPHANPDLLEKLPYDALGVKAADLIDPSLHTENAVASYLNSYVIAYRTDKKRPHPKTWAEFFDVTAFPGKRALYNWPYGMIEIALLADGVALKDLYPLNFDRAFAKIKSIRDNIVFWNTGAEAQQLIVSDAVDYIVSWSSRVAYLALGGMPVGIEWNQNVRLVDVHTIPKGTKKRDASVAFIKTALDPDVQAAFAQLSGGLSPVTKEGLEKVDAALKPYLSTTPENWDMAVGGLDDKWWGANLGDTSTKWDAFVGK